ncbi:hypothetical protein HanIR_Chr17g0862361 [Helianthus annuus]|nr:hypothetical protein HanIR_Chr17g0862361 [Helianthus annuus]
MEYMRLQRHKMGADDFEPLTMIGKGAFVEVEKLKNSMVNLRSGKMKMVLIRAMMTVLLWICLVQLTALGGSLGPRVLKGWPSCFTQDSHSAAALDVKLLPLHARVLPHKRVYKNNGYLVVSCNGGLNQMRSTLDKSSFLADPSDFEDIFDVDHFITSLRDEVRILKQLPATLKKRDKVRILKRKDGLFPLTPEETALTLRSLDIDRDIQIYIAAGEIYGGKRRLDSLAAAYPKLSDIFVPTYDGNIAKVVEGHRMYTIIIAFNVFFGSVLTFNHIRNC